MNKLAFGVSHDIWQNQAQEQYLAERLPEKDRLLYICQNHNAVSVGRHQNPFRECDLKLMEAEGVKLARRPGGGGVIFLTRGTLRFSVSGHGLEDPLPWICKALRALSLPVEERPGENALYLNGRVCLLGVPVTFNKVTCRQYALFINEDFRRADIMLYPSREDGRVMPLARESCINLCEVQPSLTMEKVFQALHNEFAEKYGRVTRQALPAQEELRPFYQNYASWDWRFGKSHPFSCSLVKRFPFGGVQLCLNGGSHVDYALVHSDMADAHFIDVFSPLLLGAPFTGEGMCLVLAEKAKAFAAPYADYIIDISAWLKNAL